MLQRHHKHTFYESFLISASKVLDGHLLLVLHTNWGQRILFVAILIRSGSDSLGRSYWSWLQ